MLNQLFAADVWAFLKYWQIVSFACFLLEVLKVDVTVIYSQILQRCNTLFSDLPLHGEVGYFVMTTKVDNSFFLKKNIFCLLLSPWCFSQVQPCVRPTDNFNNMHFHLFLKQQKPVLRIKRIIQSTIWSYFIFTQFVFLRLICVKFNFSGAQKLWN